MDKKDVARVKKGLTVKKCSIDRVVAYYMTANKKGTFITPGFQFLSEEEVRLYLSLLSKTISGKLGSNLVEYQIHDQVKIGTLDTLRRGDNSGYGQVVDEEEFLQHIAEIYACETDFCILLGYGMFDIDNYEENGQGFLLCSICPCIPDKSALAFDVNEKTLRDRLKDIPVSSALHGFLYPVYENGETDLSRVLWYSRKTEQNQPMLTEELFGVIEAADETAILNEVLKKDGQKSIKTILNVFSEASDYLETAPEETIDIPAMGKILKNAGIETDGKLQAIKDMIPTGKLSSFTEDGYLTIKSQDFMLRIPSFKVDDIIIKKEGGLPYLMLRVDLGDPAEVNGLDCVLALDEEQESANP